MSLNFVFILPFIQLFYTLWSTLLTFLEQKLFFGCSIKFQFWNVQNTNFSGIKIDTILFLVWITSFPVKWWSKSCYKFLVLKCNKMGQKTSSMARKVSQSVSSMFGATGDDKDGANHSSALAITPFIYTKKGYLRIHHNLSSYHFLTSLHIQAQNCCILISFIYNYFLQIKVLWWRWRPCPWILWRKRYRWPFYNGTTLAKSDTRGQFYLF